MSPSIVKHSDSLFSSRGDTLKPSKMFLYSFGFECQGCWQIIGCKIQEEWGLNPHEGQPISFCSAVADLESEIEKKLGLNPHEIQLISFFAQLLESLRAKWRKWDFATTVSPATVSRVYSLVQKDLLSDPAIYFFCIPLTLNFTGGEMTK